MNNLERHLRRLLRGGLVDRALSEALGGDAAQWRATAARSQLAPGRSELSRRSYYRTKKALIERLAETVRGRVAGRHRGSAPCREPMPIALPMVDQLVPEPITADGYRGSDLGRALSAAALAAEMAGDRQRADTLLSQAGDHVCNQFGRLDLPSAFEVTQNRFFIARCRSDLTKMRACIRATTRLYDRLNPAARLKYLLDCSELYLYEGRLRDARCELDFALLNASPGDGTLLQSIVLLREAQIALSRRELRTAEHAADTAMRVARPHADIRVYAAEVLGRSSLQTGNRWSSYGLEECQSAFHALSLRTLVARHHLRRGNVAAAYDEAERCYRNSVGLRYWNLASRSAATLAVCLGPDEGRPWLGRALRLYLSAERQNAYVGDDLFDAGPRGLQVMGSFLQSDAAAASIDEVFQARFPSSALESEGGGLASEIAGMILHGAAGTEPSDSAKFFTAAARKLSRQSVGVHEVERATWRLGRLVCALSILLPLEQRGDFVAAGRRQTNRAIVQLRRCFARYNWHRRSTA